VSSASEFPSMPGHIPVLFSEVLQHLKPQTNQSVIDATLGDAGHALGLLEAIAPRGRLLGLEADQRTLTATAAWLKRFGPRFVPVQGNFRDLKTHATTNHFTQIHCCLFDLGLSSTALADASRGFSFQSIGPLDMRLDPETQTLTAAAIINDWSADRLIDLFHRLGQEPAAVRIAEWIVAQRRTKPLTDTGQLADLVTQAMPRHGRLHPATRVFQALRMMVNDELGALQSALPQALELLVPGGRLAVISFHSLEDRVVKEWTRQSARAGQVRILTKHVIVPSPTEVRRNPRARSAKLRVIEKNN